MKVLYCEACKSLVRLRKWMRSCECGKVRGRYRKDGKHAEVSHNEHTISMAIGNGSFDHAVKKMRWLERDKPKATRKDYQKGSSVIAWVRPNSGRGKRAF
jgi:hypothetical protein